MTNAKKSVLVISSHVVRGSVGNRAAVFALESLGFPVWAVPTVTMAWHPGHGAANRIVPENKAFRLLLEDIGRAPWLDELGGILTGYMGSAEQVGEVAKLVSALKARNRDLLYVCDPVIGDVGGLYVPQATADNIRDQLLPLADIITPNRFELQYLAGQENLETAGQCVEAVRAMAIPQALVTSVPGFMKNHIGNCLVSEKSALFCEHLLLDNPPNGPGDLTAAVFLANRLMGHDDEEALRRTTSSVHEILADTTRSGGNELALERNAVSLAQPHSMVSFRNLGLAAKKAQKIRLKPNSL